MELLNKYKHLVKNTFIFAIGTFSSKILVFVLMPIYTRTLTTEQYGIVDLVVQTANLLFPLVTLGMTNAIIRFGVDRSYRKNDVFTAGLLATFVGFASFLCFSPLLGFIQGIGDNISSDYLCVYLLYQKFKQYVRSLQRLYEAICF